MLFRYPGLKLVFLLDFKEELPKPRFDGREGYEQRRPDGVFLIEEQDVRDCIEVMILEFSYFSILFPFTSGAWLSDLSST